MASDAAFSFILSSFLFIALASAAPFLSEDIFESGAYTGRSLLQAKKACTVDFQNQNYTILTSQCKGPLYPPTVCCNAFKQFACPFADQISDMTTDCATVMFSYINIYGKYPPGLFANECKEGNEGLDCRSVDAASPTPSSNGSNLVAPKHSLLLMLASCFMAMFFLFHLV
ncbi:GPI-anchored protein LLG1 [Prosopis cineraria]|uniref:GPI-anchored protein LLG1 n=1 Tax=Prosopis cineraria TaxID=364024 RepID=UPI00240FE916|nr:GPI-anchored protein LLG1 [Prosopis cineraria]